MPMAFSTEARQAEEQFRSLQSTLNEINSLKFKFVTRRTTVSSEGQDNILDDDDNNNNSKRSATLSTVRFKTQVPILLQGLTVVLRLFIGSSHSGQTAPAVPT